MPSFDVVSEIAMHEAANALDQANREVAGRFDFKGSDARFERAGNVITLVAGSEFQIDQMRDILYNKLSRRGVDIRAAEPGEVQEQGKRAKQAIVLRQGIDQELARQIVKLVKDSRLKVQAAIQGEQVRVTGKKRDDLQAVIAALKQADLGLPLQFTNFRD